MGWTEGRQGNGVRAIGLAALLCLLGCGGADVIPPTVALASTTEMQAGFERLINDWARSSREERLAMKPRLTAFQAANAAEPLTRTVDALLAWIALEQGDYAQAARTARFVQSVAGPGTISDLGRTVEGAALRRSGHPEQALALLSPLRGKLIDGYVRALLNEEIVESALAAKRYAQALDLMARWLREAAAEEHDYARGQIEQKLTKLPQKELLTVLDRTRPDTAELADEEQEMRRVVAQRLAGLSREARDVELAKHLLATSGSLLGDQGDAVAKLATGENRARVEARTVGLLLSFRSDETRRRDAEVADGVTFGLGLPGSAARLMTRDDRGDLGHIDDALASLSADGASILIAGVDDAEAEAAARFAEQNQIPVILLTPPPLAGRREGESPGRFTFLLGADRAAVEDALAAALAARGATSVAILSGDPRRRRSKVQEVMAVRGCAEASSPWKTLGATGIVLNASCASEAMMAAAGTRARLGAGFEAGLLSVPSGSLRATAGLFPLDAGRPPAALNLWMTHHAVEPSYWAALGRDAAMLAWTGVQVLPARGTEDPKEVAARRAQAAQALAGAEAELWTSDARGFGGTRVLPRSIGVREVK